ncbi:hypothetical protein CROQUDRAFT_222051 [Cronartium quercuum f. sp. fusiforme G11]|uniref:Uncharacterized protein n=1 Tax=Cronartium quercuum f. sp. fusiforme G11 TaxID=708437 RepID=A0A9P6NB51_9BASI|nr:hypothetical protein CROQUDRAFT_222051 [Cronartium quercuum f. sp. fusiforme G11]
MFTLPIQLVLFINARHYRTFNLQQHSSFTISHLKKSLGEDFEAPAHQIHFTLVSGLFILDNDCLFDLRASDGNHASLDITLPECYSSSALAGKVISFKFRENPQPNDLEGVTSDGLQKVKLEQQIGQPEYHGAPASPTSPESPNLTLRLTREQKIALRAQYEDPFSISSRSCIEEEFEQEDYADDGSDGDIDDDLYSDDGGEETLGSDCDAQNVAPARTTAEPTEKSATCPADSSQLRYEQLVALASITSFQHPKREIPIRSWLLKSNFQRKLHKEIQHLRLANTAPANMSEIHAPAALPAETPVVVEHIEHPTNQPTLSSEKVQEEVGLSADSLAKPRPSLRQLVIPELSSALSVGVINHENSPKSALPLISVTVENGKKRPSTGLRLTNLLLALQRTRAYTKPERRQNKVIVIQRRSGVHTYTATRSTVSPRTAYVS